MKKNRIIALLLAVLTMIAALTGCGEAVVPADTQPDTSQSTPADDTRAPAPAETDPVVTEPEETTPDSSQSAPADDTQATVPEEPEPEETKPAETEPKATEPTETKPAATEPKATEPAETKPAATEPKATEPEVTVPAPTQPEPTPEKTAFPLAGTWREIQRTAEDVSNSYILIDEDGNVTTSTGETWTLQTAPQGIVWDEEVQLGYYYEPGREYKSLSFNLYENTYVMKRGHSGLYVEGSDENRVRYYYREEDHPAANYDVVELTADNFTDYLTYVGHYKFGRNDNGEITTYAYYEELQFKAGLGPHSFVLGEFTRTFYHQIVTLDPMTGEITVDETSKRYSSFPELYPTESAEFCAAGDYQWAHINVYFIYDVESTDPIEWSVAFDELTGAKEIIGRVYVPKGWTP